MTRWCGSLARHDVVFAVSDVMFSKTASVHSFYRECEFRDVLDSDNPAFRHPSLCLYATYPEAIRAAERAKRRFDEFGSDADFLSPFSDSHLRKNRRGTE